MLLTILFVCYFVSLVLGVGLFTLSCSLRLQIKCRINPSSLTLLSPLMLHYIITKIAFGSIHPLLSLILPSVTLFILNRILKKVVIVGITGGIASGKSSVVTDFRSKNACTLIDCDLITHQLSQRGAAGYRLILRLLGSQSSSFVLEDGSLDRSKLSDYTFRNPDFKKTLTRRMGFHIMFQIVKQIVRALLSSTNLILIEAPILYETKTLTYICYPIVVIGCSEETQIKNLMNRNKLSREEALLRIKAQMPLEAKKKLSDIYINNETTISSASVQLSSKLTRIIQHQKRKKII